MKVTITSGAVRAFVFAGIVVLSGCVSASPPGGPPAPWAVERAAALEADDPGAAVVMARSLRRADRFDDAEAVLVRAAERLGETRDLLTEISRVRIAAGRPEAAIDPALRAVSMDPSSWDALDVLAVAEALVGRLDDAARNSERAVALSGGSARAVNNRAVILGLAGRDVEAIHLLARLAAAPGAPREAAGNLTLFGAAVGGGAGGLR